jgi:hypothetical protein
MFVSVPAEEQKTEGVVMNSSNENKASCPALFKAQDKSSNKEVYFETSQEAYEWMLSHRNWILKKRETINWTFPLEQIIAQDCWVELR